MVQVDPGDILLNFVLAVSSVDAPSTDAKVEDEEELSRKIIESPVMGFVYM